MVCKRTAAEQRQQHQQTYAIAVMLLSGVRNMQANHFAHSTYSHMIVGLLQQFNNSTENYYVFQFEDLAVRINAYVACFSFASLFGSNEQIKNNPKLWWLAIACVLFACLFIYLVICLLLSPHHSLARTQMTHRSNDIR